MFTLRTTLILVVSFATAVAAGILTHYTGQPDAAAVLAGGGTFGATLLFLDKVVE
jgi:hypothetical protein